MQHDGNGQDLDDQEIAIREALRKFWEDETREIEALGTDMNEFKNQALPLARIKKIMKSDEDVRMIASEAPILFAKACEFFIIELTHRAWCMSEDIKRKTLQRIDVARAIAKTDTLDFLQDIITLDDAGNEGGAGPGPSSTAPGGGGGAPSSAPQPAAAAGHNPFAAVANDHEML